VYSGGAPFEFQPGRWLYWIGFPQSLQTYSGTVSPSEHDRFSPDPLQFIIHHLTANNLQTFSSVNQPMSSCLVRLYVFNYLPINIKKRHEFHLQGRIFQIHYPIIFKRHVCLSIQRFTLINFKEIFQNSRNLIWTSFDIAARVTKCVKFPLPPMLTYCPWQEHYEQDPEMLNGDNNLKNYFGWIGDIRNGVAAAQKDDTFQIHGFVL
jgi:hypothetical protein